MSFGLYRPTMGVASGHRELSSNHTLQEQRRQGERMTRQENPITHEPASTSGRPPSGNLQAGLLPSKGPLDHMTVPDRDVPQRRVDPSRNRSHSLHSGVACVPVSDEPQQRTLPSRVTSGQLGEGFLAREPTPERRTSPGQVVRGGVRPKDSLSGGGCLASDRPDHPLALPRKAGSCGPGVGTGGSGHIVQGPNGFVPAGPVDFDVEVEAPVPLKRASSGQFRPVWGAAAGGR
uniref:Uncharacterized protein n=1 Tax=Alexandrium monilatum TaxID=311494 RepID=A0A7S4SDN4_9DINO|mmetsp:Transcript_86105/g.256925  ORF Transcript_86105/g.256925 Transcript_86105/m.256925 type:complete len:233 (+) Transcript_86105:108-806(+)|eukprot:CAMPEP_0175216260 /NCGR_PEP_ID=MMETSP0093-20121207/17636_1 /TAXON_ID=311494 /ORGANISM="Alexandrium monilatum, Strain CCMP3105" /LENGTH=232 /DNA_ID=CAMNT_0016509649 /DNA_START=49 /DNA_END=747 /DNA_ORIENTATION=-